MHLDQKISLKHLNTFGLEVESRYFVEARTHADVMTLLNYRNMIFMPVMILGGGSNILFTRDFAGLIVHVNTKGTDIIHEDDQHIQIKVQAGENWDGFVKYCVEQNWAGLENLSMIPGTVGAAPIQNIGAYGVEARELIEKVFYVDITTGKHHELTNVECKFGYRDSIFKRELKGKIIITEVVFKLQKCVEGQTSNLKLDYGDLRAELVAENIANPTISDVRNAVCRIRGRKFICARLST